MAETNIVTESSAPGTERDLWPDVNFYQKKEIPAPRQILRQQAEFFARHMKNILTAWVESSLPRDGSFQTFHNFWIVAPLLGERKYKLFYARHKSQLYPVTLVWGEDDQDFRECQTPQELREALSALFRDQRTVDVIAGMLVDSEAAGDDEEEPAV